MTWNIICLNRRAHVFRQTMAISVRKQNREPHESTHFRCPMLTPPRPEVQFPVRGRCLFIRRQSGVAGAGVKLRPALRQSACQLTGVSSAHPGHTVPLQATRVRDGHAFTAPKTKRRGKGRGVARQAGRQAGRRPEVMLAGFASSRTFSDSLTITKQVE